MTTAPLAERTTAGVANDVRPMTGAEYLESLRDGREIYIRGERVDDVTTHPAFRNSARSVARMYDALHEPAAQGVLSVPTDTGNGGFTHPFFKTAHSADDLVVARDAIATWQREVYGWLGRSPDYKASFLGTLGANADFYGEYKQNALNWYKKSQERVLYLNHAIVNPPIDRDKPADETADVCVHVVDETDAGLIVSGAKVVATGSAITNANFIAHYGLPLRKKEFGLIFTVPMDSPGLKLFCRTSYEMNAAVTGTPFDYPLSSRFDENDSIMVFDRVLVPWENVFAYDVETTNGFVMKSGFLNRFMFHGCARLAVKLDFIAGCVMKGVEMTGSAGFRGVQMQIGEILNWRDMFWGLSDAMAKSPDPWVNGAVQPNINYGLAYRTFMGVGYPRIKEIIQQVLGSGLIYLNSHADDWKNPDVAPYLDQYVRGSNGIAAIDRVQLLKLLWDAVGTEFGGRHELYERNYGGDHEAVRFQTLFAYQASGQDLALKGFAEQCMSEYDVDGWTRPDLINNDDLTIVWDRR
ncbi:Pyoverdin chromophore biosynthetic protein pvcC [Gordonia desulfuricans]|uniref:Pyoverdin chromophore biosynthetic protein pvcC n=1 Tax=Gordonia desulfuricans TaxID=89051 RepID=A0A7K3LR44_9ACTN|nr:MULTISPECIES: 4-hydroxyphenylacetate 3-hydroxylase N-terminal domain-containing protein [Gordonia]EMP14998.2 Pyoverdin chromophore biosynthetic protein pvcC [Gordonia sp. NB41Y]NDK90732.1 Pyoverdin chromophore biosynthetic protein pvcC [Gordonia desulfuricans]WLP88768.1 4-hydroxyphenylacetate 3-hydroxylase N-terminal domain-containing protein [Gordonia sp. NB41Y]